MLRVSHCAIRLCFFMEQMRNSLPSSLGYWQNSITLSAPKGWPQVLARRTLPNTLSHLSLSGGAQAILRAHVFRHGPRTFDVLPIWNLIYLQKSFSTQLNVITKEGIIGFKGSSHHEQEGIKQGPVSLGVTIEFHLP